MPQRKSSNNSPKMDNSKQQESKPAAKTQPIPIPKSTATIKNHSKPASSESSSKEDLFDQGDQKGEKDPNRPALAPFIVESRPGLGQNPDRRDRQIIERPFPNAESHAPLVFPPDFSKEKNATHGSGEKPDLLPSSKAKAVAFTGNVVDKDNTTTITGSIVDKDSPVAVAGTTIDKANPIVVAGSSIDKVNPVQSSKGTGEKLAGPSIPKQPKPKPQPQPQSTPSAARADEATSSDERVTDPKIGEMEDWLFASENPIWPMKEKGKEVEKRKGKGKGKGKEKEKEKEKEKGKGKEEGKVKEEDKEKKKEEKGNEKKKEKKKEEGKEKEEEKGKGKEKEKEKKGKGKEEGSEEEKEKKKEGKAKEKAKGNKKLKKVKKMKNKKEEKSR